MPRPLDPAALRARSLQRLARAKFKVSKHLPLYEGDLRPHEEIARRLLALDAVFTWVSQVHRPAKDVRSFVRRNKLLPAMTRSERAIYKQPRARAHEHVGTIGWLLENMWPLAWILGFRHAVPFDGDMIRDAKIQAMWRFLPKLGETLDQLLAHATPRKAAQVLAAADLFYCRTMRPQRTRRQDGA